MSFIGEDMEAPTAMRRSWSRRPVVVGAAVVAAVALVGLGVATSGARPASLASFRRQSLDKETVELVGKSKALDGFNCFLDTSQATLRLAAIIMVARGGPAACSDQSTTVGRAKCSATINVVFYNFAIMASLIAMSISDCSRTLVMPAACAAGVTGAITTVDVMAAGVSGIIASCNLWWNDVKVPPTGVTTTKAPLFTTRTRKFFTTPAATPPTLPFPTKVPSTYWWNNSNKAAYGSAITVCVVYMGQAFLFVGRAIVVIMDASKFCTPATQVTDGGRKHCTIDMFTLVASMALISQFIAAGTPSCSASVSDSRTRAASCAANIIGIVTSVSASTSVLMKIDKLCPSWLLTSTLAPPARLLAEAEAEEQ